MDSRFKFLQSVNPQSIANTNAKPKFSKLTLATAKYIAVESTDTDANTGVKVTKTVTHTTTTTTTMANALIEPAASGIDAIPSAQKPKILLYDSTIKSTLKTASDSDLLTDDDTDSAASSIDTEFLNKELEINENSQATVVDNIDIVDTQMQSLNIIPTQSNGNDVDFSLHSLSARFNRSLLFDENDKNKSLADDAMKTEKKLIDSIQTLSSDESLDEQENNEEGSTKSSSHIVIDLCDSDDEPEKKARKSQKIVAADTSPQPPLKPTQNNSEDYNVSSSCANRLSYPDSVVMQKVNNFFDNVPNLESENSFNTTQLSKTADEVYISETSSDESNAHKSTSESFHSVHGAAAIINQQQEAADVKEFSDNNIIVDIPVIKSRSDQPQQLIRSQSGVRLTATHSSPIIKTTNSECIKRSSSNVILTTLKNSGSLIKVNSSNGQVNISAKININIQISPVEDSSSEESSGSKKGTPKGSIIIETNTKQSSEESSEESDKNTESNPIPTKQNESPGRPKESERVVKTPSTASKLKQFEFVAPKSMTKTKPQTPKNVQPVESELPDTVDVETDGPNGFKIDENIPIEPHHQRLLHQVYGNDWKTPEVIKSYSAVKGKSAVLTAPNTTPSFKNRASKGFNLFKRNIAANLDSTRFEDNAEISMIESIETISKVVSPQKNQPSTMETPRSKKKLATNRKLDVDDQPSPSMINKPKPATTKLAAVDESPRLKKRPQRNRRRIFTLEDDSSSESEKNSQPDSDSDSVYTEDVSSTSVSITDDDSDDDFVAPKTKQPTSTRKKKPADDDSDDDFVAPKTKQPTSTRKKKSTETGTSTAKKPRNKNSKDELVYFDLSAEEVVEVNDQFKSLGAEDDLANITAKFLEIDEDIPKKKIGRKLFTPQYDDNLVDDTIDVRKTIRKKSEENVLQNVEIPRFTHKLFDSKKFGSPCTTPKTKVDEKKDEFKTPLNKPLTERNEQFGSAKSQLDSPPKTFQKYGFLKSLDVCASMMLCHPDAIIYRNNFKGHKEKLTEILYKMYNEKVFGGKLDLPVTWNKKLTTTAGRFSGKSKSNANRIELSEKVLTSADRLRCTLIHEMCHAATWIFNKEKGHGATWKSWAKKANCIFPELPKITVCHNYDIEYKYTYKCDMCNSKSQSHSKSKKVENIRCSYCHGSITIYLNKKQKDGTITLEAPREATGFAKFVKEKYKDFKLPGVKHAEVMGLISSAFSQLSVEEKKKY